MFSTNAFAHKNQTKRLAVPACRLSEGYLLGSLNEEERDDFIIHLADCLACTEFIATVSLLEEGLIDGCETISSEITPIGQENLRSRAAGGSH